MSDLSYRSEPHLQEDNDAAADADAGVPTLRVLQSLPITGMPISISPKLVHALAALRQPRKLDPSKLH